MKYFVGNGMHCTEADQVGELARDVIGHARNAASMRERAQPRRVSELCRPKHARMPELPAQPLSQQRTMMSMSDSSSYSISQ